MVVSGAALVAGALALVAGVAYLVRRWRLLAGLGTALVLGGLARAVGMASGVPHMDLADLLLWPGSGLRTGVTVGMDLPLALGTHTWSLAAVEASWLECWLLVGAGAALLALASSEERLPALVALALLGGVGWAAAGSPASGLWGGAVLLCAVAVMLGGGEPSLLFLASGAVGLVAMLLASGESAPSLASGAAVLSLAFWFGCPPWGPWTSRACRSAEPAAAGFALAFLPALGWGLLRPAMALAEPTWLLGGAVWLLAVGGLGALIHRDPRQVWHDSALINLGLTLLVAARAGFGWEGVGWALAWRSAAMAALAWGFSGLSEASEAGEGRRPWATVAVLGGLAALVGLPPLPAFGLWRDVLALGGEAAFPAWAAVAAGAWGAGALGWWRVLKGLA